MTETLEKIVTLTPGQITEISPLNWQNFKEYRIENDSDEPIYFWIGISNPEKGNESAIIDPNSKKSNFFRGQQLLVMAEKPATIKVFIKQ